MDLTDVPDDIPDSGEKPPDFDEWDDPKEVFKGGSTKERLLDVVMQLRDPTKVSTISQRAECDTETARDYLEWFAEMGIVREVSGRPVRYERNDSYLRWRRVERIQARFSEEEIVHELSKVVETLEEYRDRFDAETPGDVSLVEESHETPIEETWEVLSEWKTLERRAKLLDVARRDEGSSSGGTGRINA